jgi:hypothetical protein
MINKWNYNKVTASHEYLSDCLFHIEVINFALWGHGGDRFEELMRFKSFTCVAYKKYHYHSDTQWTKFRVRYRTKNVHSYISIIIIHKDNLNITY